MNPWFFEKKTPELRRTAVVARSSAALYRDYSSVPKLRDQIFFAPTGSLGALDAG